VIQPTSGVPGMADVESTLETIGLHHGVRARTETRLTHVTADIVLEKASIMNSQHECHPDGLIEGASLTKACARFLTITSMRKRTPYFSKVPKFDVQFL
jgi:hypothetical protein